MSVALLKSFLRSVTIDDTDSLRLLCVLEQMEGDGKERER